MNEEKDYLVLKPGDTIPGVISKWWASFILILACITCSIVSYQRGYTAGMKDTVDKVEELRKQIEQLGELE